MKYKCTECNENPVPAPNLKCGACVAKEFKGETVQATSGYARSDIKDIEPYPGNGFIYNNRVYQIHRVPYAPHSNMWAIIPLVPDCAFKDAPRCGPYEVLSGLDLNELLDHFENPCIIDIAFLFPIAQNIMEHRTDKSHDKASRCWHCRNSECDTKFALEYKDKDCPNRK